jgi:ATPase subunit of ABC transporter with duplicated ATPase domains
MIAAQGVSLQYGGRVLFNDVNINFTKGNCYGLIGANGAGKSTFLKILAGELEPNKGSVFITPGERMAVLKQDHFLFDEFDVVECVLYGHKRLYDIRKEKDALYMKEDFTDEDGIKAEGEFAELDGWAAESNAEMLLNGLGVMNEFHYAKMKELTGGQKVKVLLAQALFGNPDILLLDEPTNHLDIHAIKWLEDFLMNFENTVIVVSHDRHFLNKVCTNIADIDYGKITMFVGNYDFWYSYTQMTQRQLKDQNKRVEQKIKELQDFIQRFSANASKAKQATSRKKLLDNLQMDTIKPSSRRYPFCSFKQDREVGNDVLLVDGISKTIDGKKVLNDVSFMIRPHEKVAFVGKDEIARTTLFQILMGELEPDEGSFKWGITTKTAYFPKDNTEYFEGNKDSLIEWLRPFAKEGEQYDSDIRGWLGRMLFSGEEALKEAGVLSGGEKVRCMLCKMMMSGANVMILDEPTAGLDPKGRDEILAAIHKLHEERGITVILVSHSMEDVARLVDRIIVMHKGKVAMTGTPREIFSHPMELEQMGLAAPQVSYVFAKLKEKGYDVPTDIYTVEEARDALLKLVKQVKA